MNAPTTPSDKAPTQLSAIKAGAATATVATVDKKAFEQMKPKEQIAYLLEQKKGELAKMLPKTLSIERLLKVATIAATTTPALLKCDIPSLVAAIGQCAQLGLEPNTVLGHAYLVPFNTKRKDAEGRERWVNSVQVIIGYKGLIELARRSGQIVSIAAHEVCQNDKFELAYGLDEKLNHMPNMGERGPVIGFYAVAKLKDGGYSFEFMSTHQVLQIRENSQGFQQAKKYNKEGAHPWTVHFVEMGRKTAIRRLAKYLPLSIEFSTAAALDEAHTLGHDQRLDSNVIDGVTGWLPDTNDIDDPQQGGGEQADSAIGAGTSTGEQANANVGQGAAAANARPEQKPAAIENKPSPTLAQEWAPTEAEMAAIHQRELEEAQPRAVEQQQPTPRTAAARRTARPGPSME
jgi:recombination protein RecT